ncbi:hypothetical protein [Mycobacterium intracellulare]|nr:hypothetical protein [Mycobacterium intracellulare]MDV7030107.1 hypothetical protein [Mycobacterium intracellulare]
MTRWLVNRWWLWVFVFWFIFAAAVLTSPAPCETRCETVGVR